MPSWLFICIIALAGFNQHFNPYADVTAVVVIGSPADEVAVHHARLVHESPAAHFEVEFTLRHGCHFAALDATGVSRYFHAVTYAGDGLVRLEEVPGNADKVFVIANILRRPSAGEEYTKIFLRLDVLECDVRLQRVALELPGDLPVPVRRNFVQHRMVSPLLRPGNDRLETVLLQTVIRIQCIDRLSGLTDYNQYLIHFVSNIEPQQPIVNSENT
jgi:hypothetical protein